MRLTKQVAEFIVNKAVEKSGILEKFADLRVARAVWAEKCRIDALGGDENAGICESIAEQISVLRLTVPKSVAKLDCATLRTDDDIYMNVGGLQFRAQFNGASPQDKISKSGVHQVFKITPERHTLIGGTPLAIEFDELLATQRELNKNIEALRLQVTASISNFTTTDKLLKAWPEAIELLPVTDPAVPRKQLPALKVETLNALLGLPTSKALL